MTPWWDNPVDIQKNADGTYTQWGKKREKKPYWRIDSPRMILASVLFLLFLLWMEFMPVLFSVVTERILLVILLVFIIVQYAISWRAYRKF